jgi:hypothetical protein
MGIALVDPAHEFATRVLVVVAFTILSHEHSTPCKKIDRDPDGGK